MRIKTRDMILISMFAALTAIGAFIKIPTPIVPFTLQFLFCAYSGMFLGARYGLYSQLLYVGIGLAGIPIFASGGGPTYVLQPTFGYLIGFILCATLIGKLTENMKEVSFKRVFPSVLAGLAMVYIFGVSYLYMIVNLYFGKAMSVNAAIAAGFLPYITSDLILSAFVAATAVYVVPALRRAGYSKIKCKQ
ncbi:biotin transport system substrate-specific component [Peptoclostridium litorale DSM 5388]|uniref:Biotin transporter n=1 Tax=Peptoclostridium litorale DSM 5388 TaxID=1121324 RepID=A0A069RHA0_PEPLI|nr:biotin transporter BioY [Peptoclostridium litorale]KDR96143.1 putative biotin transporter BioY [Peptoclostridium litorale DSM 5388]SIO03689.1 biotin transport system substrate-specific component [Peptoclostridium litorale DSM 5388]